MSTQPATKASVGANVSHLVLNVRDIEASHRFYTEVLGFEQCGEMTHTMTMRFYRGDPRHHHDLALVPDRRPASAPEPQPWSMAPTQIGMNHVAIGLPRPRGVAEPARPHEGQRRRVTSAATTA